VDAVGWSQTREATFWGFAGQTRDCCTATARIRERRAVRPSDRLEGATGRSRHWAAPAGSARRAREKTRTLSVLESPVQRRVGFSAVDRPRPTLGACVCASAALSALWWCQRGTARSGSPRSRAVCAAENAALDAVQPRPRAAGAIDAGRGTQGPGALRSQHCDASRSGPVLGPALPARLPAQLRRVCALGA
jgi:hypothetical protein